MRWGEAQVKEVNGFTYRGWAPGSCGELVQGRLPREDGGGMVDFHISCPVSLYSRVEVRLREDSREIVVFPADRQKAARSVRLYLDFWGVRHIGANITVSSPLPPGKGMASSTADIGAALAAVSGALGMPVDPGEISARALALEPTDGTLYPGIVYFGHRGGGLLESHGKPPALEVGAVDTGGCVDTLAFNAGKRAYLHQEEELIAEARELVAEGFRRRDPGLIGKGATISARVNQRLLPKPHLEELIEVIEAAGALGLCVAHSGTVVGAICRPGGSCAVRKAVAEWLGPRAILFACRLGGGGVWVEAPDRAWKAAAG